MTIIKRWGIWLEAVEYYCRNLPKIREMFSNIKETLSKMWRGVSSGKAWFKIWLKYKNANY